MALLLKNLLFTALVPGAVAGWLPWLLVGEGPAAAGPLRLLGLVLFALGGAVYCWCVWDFASIGRGTPAPIDAPKALVVRGLYRYTRNPMYVGVLTTVLGWAALYAAPVVLAYAALVGCTFHAFVRLYEEPRLEREFGAQYAAYRARVPRWLLGSG